MNAYQVAEYYGVTGDVVRKRRSRTVAKLRKALDEEPESDDFGGTSDGTATAGRQVAGYDALSNGNPRRAEAIPDTETGDTDVTIQ